MPGYMLAAEQYLDNNKAKKSSAQAFIYWQWTKF